MTGDAEAEAARTQWVGPVERRTLIGIAGMVGGLGLVGLGLSFAQVTEAMRPSFGDLAPLVPIGIDLGIFAFTALDLLMANRGVRMRGLRLVPWGLIAVTIYLNIADETTLKGQVGHAVLPLLWVIGVEVAGLAARTIFGLRGGAVRMERIRRSRWLLAPVSTARLWRRMILWEETSYPAALVRERERVLAKTDLQDAYGELTWLWRAPRRARVLYRLGEQVPSTLLAPPYDEAGADRDSDLAALPPASSPAPIGTPAGAAADGTDDPRAAAALAAGRAILADGKAITRDELSRRLRHAGMRHGTDTARDLVNMVKATLVSNGAG